MMHTKPFTDTFTSGVSIILTLHTLHAVASRSEYQQSLLCVTIQIQPDA